jgi:hypothetical protein
METITAGIGMSEACEEAMKQTDDIGAMHAVASDGSFFYLSAQPVMIAKFMSRLSDLGMTSD